MVEIDATVELRRKKMFKERLISGIVLVIIALITVIIGGPILLVLLTTISVIGMVELYKILGIEKQLLGMIGYVAVVIYYGIIYMGKTELVLPLLLGTLILFMMGYVFTFPKFNSNQVMLAFFGFCYVAVMLSYIYQTRMLSGGVYTVWLVFLCSWGCDTCAYCVGVLFGKRKMAPILSPKKSIEGAIGGVVGAGLLGALYALAIDQFAAATVNPMIYAVICMVGGLISMVGDLAASGIKRDNNVKDYGNLIPGHGGILDRFDSVIFTAPVIYYMVVFLRA